MPDKPRSDRLTSIALNSLLVISLISLGIVAWLRLPTWIAWAKGQSAQGNTAPTAELPPQDDADSAALKDGGSVPLSPITVSAPAELDSIPRLLLVDTIIPTRSRVDVITYTVEAGDNLFSIADQFGLKPETILWGNFDTLEDNPGLLSTGQALNILPTNGTYYEWSAGDNLDAIASFFGVTSQDVLGYPGNRIDLTATTSNTLAIEPGTWLIIPGGTRPLKDWGPPAISRSNPATARYYGDGYCGSIYEGAIGAGWFVWPTTERSISGYGYSGIHPAVDIGGSTGNSIFASDSGVVVFSGWSNYGYGYLIVIDHGNGWQTAYAHLSAVSVGCGQSVYQGGYIGALGSTGNSTGPHLHFELVYNGAKPNPLDYLQ